MLSLSSVTLINYTTRDYEAVRRSIERSQAHCKFRNVIVFTDKPDEFPDCHSIQIPTIKKREELSITNIKHIPAHTSEYGSHVLCTHWDSWVQNPDAWRDDWLKWDYIGAPWKDAVVGNDGFGLISSRFLRAVDSLDIEGDAQHCHPADVVMSRHHFRRVKCYRGELEKLGMMYAPCEVAAKFSTEGEYAGQFGFHGVVSVASLVRQGVL